MIPRPQRSHDGALAPLREYHAADPRTRRRANRGVIAGCCRCCRLAGTGLSLPWACLKTNL